MEKNMEEIAKIFKINKTGIMQTFIILIICSVAGNIIHDVIMLMENIGLVEKDYTVFPMGSFMVIIGIIATVIFAATTYNYTRFNMDVSYGCTRKMYIIRQWVFDIVVIIMAWAGLGITYLYENWKFAAFYSGYSLELSITPLFHFKYFVVSLIMLSSFNMLISSLIIKYGIKGRRIMALAYMIICFSMAKAENIYQGIYERILTLPIGTDILLWLVTLIIAAVSAVVAILLIKKQQVAN
jgi:membrane protein